jgi:hypothetical protein
MSFLRMMGQAQFLSPVDLRELHQISVVSLSCWIVVYLLFKTAVYISLSHPLVLSPSVLCCLTLYTKYLWTSSMNFSSVIQSRS